MKILSISNTDIWPEGENKGIPSVFFSQKRFVERGHEVNFLCLANNYQQGYSDYQGIKIFRFKMPFTRVFKSISTLRLDKFLSHLASAFLSNLQWLLFQLFCLFWTIKVGINLKPDIIYVHGLTTAFPGWLASRLLKTKLVFRIYGTRELYWAFKRPLFRIKEFRDYLALKLEADYFVITNDGTQGAFLSKLIGVKEEKIINLRNGVDFGIYDPDPTIKEKVCKELGINSGSKIILSIARLIPFYSVDRLVFALPKLFKIDSEAVCIIAGDGPDKSKLKEFVNKNNIQDKVFFLGFVDRKFVAQLLNSCEIFVSLSQYSNTNNALFEAMVCAVCIVSMKDETIEGILTNEKNAILVSPEEIDKLSDILKMLLADESKRKMLGRQAQIKASQILESWPQRIDREIQLLEGLIRS